MDFLLIIISAVAGYLVNYFITNPKSKIQRKLPIIKMWRLELSPSIRITIKGKIIHLHHWFNYSVILCVSIFISSAILDSWLTRGFLMGSIVQGLRFSDRNIIKNIVN